MEDNLNKLKLEAQASEKAINTVFANLNTGLTSLTAEIETLSVSVATSQDKIDSLEKQTQELNAELAKLKQEHQSLEQEVDSKDKELASSKEKQSELQHQKNTLESEIANKESKLAELTKVVNTLKSEIDEIRDKLVNAGELRQAKVGDIEQEVNETKASIETKTNQYKVLRHFFETGYTSDSHYDVIKVLKQPGLKTVDQLVLASGVGRPAVEETLNALDTKGVVKLDGNKFTVVKEMDI